MQAAETGIDFQVTQGSGPVQLTSLLQFPVPVSTAVAVLTGFRARFVSQNGDHHLGELDVGLQTSIRDDGVVATTATFGLRDRSGDWDDLYYGRVDFTVIGF